MRSSDGEGRSIRSDALYPALSGEWEVPVTRNAKITPVNEGVGGGVGGPPLRDHLWHGPPLPVTLRLIHPPLANPPSSPFNSILERVVLPFYRRDTSPSRRPAATGIWTARAGHRSYRTSTNPACRPRSPCPPPPSSRAALV